MAWVYSVTHPINTHPVEFRTWRGIRYRCKHRRNYADRGISVCERWERSFKDFLSDMGPRPSPNHSIDRIDNNGNYEPENCRWATRKEQRRNSRQNHYLTFNGETMVMMDWAKRYGLSFWALKYRIRCGWSTERALITPTMKRRRRARAITRQPAGEKQNQ